MPRKADDPDKLIAELARAWDPNYSPEQRYADFRHIFLGTEQGKRVLYQMLSWGHLWRSSHTRGDALQTAFHEGERNLGLRIFAAVNVEPAPKSTRQARKPKDE